MGETPEDGKKKKFPAAALSFGQLNVETVGKTAAGRVDFPDCLDFVCAVCGGPF